MASVSELVEKRHGLDEQVGAFVALTYHFVTSLDEGASVGNLLEANGHTAERNPEWMGGLSVSSTLRPVAASVAMWEAEINVPTSDEDCWYFVSVGKLIPGMLTTFASAETGSGAYGDYFRLYKQVKSSEGGVSEAIVDTSSGKYGDTSQFQTELSKAIDNATKRADDAISGLNALSIALRVPEK